MIKRTAKNIRAHVHSPSPRSREGYGVAGPASLRYSEGIREQAGAAGRAAAIFVLLALLAIPLLPRALARSVAKPSVAGSTLQLLPLTGLAGGAQATAVSSTAILNPPPAQPQDVSSIDGTVPAAVAPAQSQLPKFPYSGPFRVLIVYADTDGAPTQLRSQILAEPGVTAVDLFDAFSGTPTLGVLQQYNIVVPFSNSTFQDPITLGNNLADYVDAGGIVVQYGFSHYGPGQAYGINGRWVSGDYNPYNYSTNLVIRTPFTLGAFNAGHPLMAGVTTLNGDDQNVVMLAAGATQVAAASNGNSLVAFRPVSGGHITVGVTAFVGADSTQSGHWGKVIVNAGTWLLTCRTPYDFNLDSKPDYVLYNGGTRQTAVWYLNNNVFLSGAFGPTLPAGWRLVAVADFNGDGKPDYALFNASTRQTAIWYLSGVTLISGAFGPTLPSGWQLVAVGDFNGDCQPDYVLYNASTHQTAVWYLNNNVFLGGAFGPTLPAGWKVAGVADFNRDGKTDYLLFNASTRQSAIWYLHGVTLVGSAFGPTIASGYQLTGTADFNGDGKPDYVLYNTSTQRTALWYLNNNVLIGSAYGPILPAGWSLVAP
jgi:elongation factor P hydroxylase